MVKFKLRYSQKIVLTVIIATFVPIIAISSVYLWKTYEGNKALIINNNSVLLKNGAENMNAVYYANIQKLGIFQSNFKIMQYLGIDNSKDLTEIMDYNAEIDSVISTFLADGYGNEIHVFSLNPNIMETNIIRNAGELEETLKNDILKWDNDGIFIKQEIFKDRASQDKICICLYRKAIDINNKVLAIIRIKIDIEVLMKFFQFTIPEGSYIFLQSANDDVPLVLNKNIKAGDNVESTGNGGLKDIRPEEFYVIDAGTQLKESFGNVSMYIAKYQIYNQVLTSILLTLAIIALIIMGVILMEVIVIRRMTARFENVFVEINKDIEKLLTSDDIRHLEVKDDELGRIYSKFFELISKIKEYYSRVSLLENEKRKVELDLMQALINPHFLYNTLSGIKCVFNDKKLSEIVDSMVKYYRIALNRGNRVINISKELTMVEEYLKLQKFAYDSDMQYSIEVDECIVDCYTIKHILQPVVENAILHGINALNSGGLIRITGKLSAGKIIFKVSDNGPGMDEETLARVFSAKNISVIGGYGLLNTKKRIEAYFGDEYGIEISSVQGKGTEVCITIPEIKDENFLC